MAAQGHEVQFYDDDPEMVDVVTSHALARLRNGVPVLMVATPEHRACVASALVDQGVDLAAARAQGRFVAIDAAGALSGFVVAGRPDPDLFEAQLCAVLDSMGSASGPVWVYGEMVALLCAEGNVAAAMELEALWNALATTRPFSLLCGYPTSMLDSAALEHVAVVCECHTQLDPPTSYLTSPSMPALGEAARSSKVFVPAPEAVAGARHFIAEALHAWGQGSSLIDDAMLLTSEMATNALVHAHSPFRMSVAMTRGALTVSVQDATSRTPELRMVDARSATGRGMGIVEALASSWGCEVLPTGKVVWAELRRPA